MLELKQNTVQLHSIHSAAFGGHLAVLDAEVSLTTEDIPFPMVSLASLGTLILHPTAKSPFLSMTPSILEFLLQLVREVE